MRMWNIIVKSLSLNGKRISLVPYRTKIRGKHPTVAKSLKEKLAAISYKDPELHFQVDIGLPPPKLETRKQLMEKSEYLRNRKFDLTLEKTSRELKLNVDLNEVSYEWSKTVGPQQTYNVAKHYGIYSDLFGDAYFIPYISMEIGFPQLNGLEAPVHRGNVIKPAEALVEPNVFFESEKDTYWTLILTNPDGHLTCKNMEYVHWFVGNIPGNDLAKGEVIWDFLPPFPSRGIGFQRFIFILYKQEKVIDYSHLKKTAPCISLDLRTFNTLEFYKEKQNDLTPSGLLFFQSDWDKSVIDTYHKKLEMDEPIFEYDHEEYYRKKEKWFPQRKPFNLYLDKYRDPRDLNKHYLLDKVKNLNPFQKPKKPFPYPNTLPIKKMLPSWLKVKIARDRLGKGRIRDFMEDEYE